MAGHEPTLLSVAIANLQQPTKKRPKGLGLSRAGFEAMKVIVTLTSYAVCKQELGGTPTQSDYREFWSLKVRTAEREWAQVRDAFPGEDGPERLGVEIANQASKQLLSKDCAAIASFQATKFGFDVSGIRVMPPSRTELADSDAALTA